MLLREVAPPVSEQVELYTDDLFHAAGMRQSHGCWNTPVVVKNLREHHPFGDTPTRQFSRLGAQDRDHIGTYWRKGRYRTYSWPDTNLCTLSKFWVIWAALNPSRPAPQLRKQSER